MRVLAWFDIDAIGSFKGILDLLDPHSCSSFMAFKLPKPSRSLRSGSEQLEFPPSPVLTQEDIRSRFREQYLANSALSSQ